MTTINNQDDFLRALRENPEWKDAVRAQILGEELLRLPVQFNEFRGRMETFVERQEETNRRQEEFNARMDQSIERLDAANVRMDRFIERQEEFNARMDQSIERLDAANVRMDQFIERQEETNRNVIARSDRMEGDSAFLKGHYAQTIARNQAMLIAHELGLQYEKTLTEADLFRISRQAEGSLSASELRSFRRADLVIEAVQDSETVYIPVEVSFTGDHRDSDRALRNAELLSRFTGKPAVATLASFRNDRYVAGLVESGALRWYEMDQKYLDRITPEPMEPL